jgi:long-chain acyl-CoA synthetase
MFLTSKEGIAIKFKNQIISYLQLISKVHEFSKLYEINEDDKVVIFSENRPAWIYAFHSVWNNSGVVLPIDYLSTSEEVNYILNDCEPKIIFYSDDSLEVLNEALVGLNFKGKLISLDKFENTQAGENTSILKERKLKETALIIYTSGTTGSPKGVMLSFENIFANIDAVSKKVEIFREDRPTMILLPLHHIFPLIGSMVAPLSTGAIVGIAPSMASEDIISTLNENKIAIIIGVPRLYSAIRKGIKNKIEKSKIAKLLFSLAGAMHSYKFSR